MSDSRSSSKHTYLGLDNKNYYILSMKFSQVNPYHENCESFVLANILWFTVLIENKSFSKKYSVLKAITFVISLQPYCTSYSNNNNIDLYGPL